MTLNMTLNKMVEILTRRVTKSICHKKYSIIIKTFNFKVTCPTCFTSDPVNVLYIWCLRGVTAVAHLTQVRCWVLLSIGVRVTERLDRGAALSCARWSWRSCFWFFGFSPFPFPFHSLLSSLSSSSQLHPFWPEKLKDMLIKISQNWLKVRDNNCLWVPLN